VKRILFADDDPLVARIYRDKLADEGFDVAVAEDGVVAMKRLVEFKPDVVVLDLLMPKMNGADVIKFIRQHAELKDTPVIVFSNSLLAALAEPAATEGVEQIPKSTATPGQLIDLIHKALLPKPRAAAAIRLRVATPSAAESPRPPADKAKGTEFRNRVQQEFREHLPRVVSEIRELSKGILEAATAAVELKRVEELGHRVGFLTQTASMAGFNELAQLSSALELMLFHLQEKKTAMTDSCRYTIAAAVAFLTLHLGRFEASQPEAAPVREVLVVDDDLVSTRGIVQALELAKMRVTSIADPLEALERLKQHAYGLVLLDVELPHMNGMVLCEQLRRLDRHRHTPVVFITGHHDSKTRARSILSGGNDFISKPIVPIELTVKVSTLLLQARMDGGKY